jgi:hypothetical protein
MFRNIRISFCGIFMLVFSSLLQAQENISLAWGNVLNQSVATGGSIVVRSIKVDASGNSYVAGEFFATADMDPGPGVVNLTSKGGSDIFFAKYDASGNYVFSKRMGDYYDDHAGSLAVDASGNVFVAGYFQGTVDFNPGVGTASLTSAGVEDIFFAKYDASGNYIFAKRIGSISTDKANAMVIDGNSNIYLTGYFNLTVDFDPGSGITNLSNSGNKEIFFARYNASGELVYAQKIGASNNDEGTALSVDAGGNLWLAGNFDGTVDFDPGAGTQNLTCTAGSNDIFFAKYDATGAYQYARHLSSSLFSSKYVNSIVADGSGNVHLAGNFYGQIDFDPGNGTQIISGDYDAFFAKYNANGEYMYAKEIGEYNGWDGAYGLAIDASGNVYITGYFQGTIDADPGVSTANLISSNGSIDIFFAKYDVNGNYLFAKQAGGTGTDYGMTIAVDGSGRIFIGGYFGGTADMDPGSGTVNLVAPGSVSNAFWGAYDASGAYRFAGQLGTYSNSGMSSYVYDVAADGSGNVFVIGKFFGTIDVDPGAATSTLTSTGNADVFLAKYSASGGLVFAHRFGGTNEDIGYGLVLDGSGNVYVTGSFRGTVDFDPGAGTQSLTSAGWSDMFFAKYSASGNYVFAFRMGAASQYLYGRKISLDGNGNIYVAGTFTSTVDFDPGAGTTNLVSAGSADVFFNKYDANGGFVYAKRIGGTNYDELKGLAVDASGTVHLSGNFSGTADFDPGASTFNLSSNNNSSDIFFAKYDASGNYVFAHRIGSYDYDEAGEIDADPTGNIYLTGSFNGNNVDFNPGAAYNGLYGSGSSDAFFAKYNSSGEYIFAYALGSTTDDYGIDVQADVSGNVYITGTFKGYADFNPGAAYVSLSSGGGNADIFFAKYNASGNYVYAKQLISFNNEPANVAIAVDGNGHVYLTGSLASMADFEPGTAVSENQPTGDADIFLAKYTSCAAPELSGQSISAQSSTISGITSLTDGDCRLLSQVEPSGASPVSGVVNAQVWVESSVPSVSGQPYVARHYEITPATNASTSTGKVTLYFSQQEFDDYNNDPGSTTNLPVSASDAAGIANLIVRKYDGTSPDGSGLPESYTGSSTEINPVDADIVWNATAGRWEVSFAVTGFSGFIVQTSLTSLPVTLLEFSVRPINNTAHLTWKTSGEFQNKGFEVEHSINGVDFRSIGFVQANSNGNSSVTQSYQFTDNHPVNGRNFYRLRQLDMDGKTAFSQIRDIVIDRNNELRVYPNPVKDVFTVDLRKLSFSSAQLVLLDMQGRTLQNWRVAIGVGVLTLDIRDQLPGYYLLKIVNENGEYAIHRLIRQ